MALTFYGVVYNEVTYIAPDKPELPNGCCLKNLTIILTDTEDLTGTIESVSVTPAGSGLNLDNVEFVESFNEGVYMLEITGATFCDLTVNLSEYFFVINEEETTIDLTGLAEIIENPISVPLFEEFGLVIIGSSKTLVLPYTPSAPGVEVNVFVDCGAGLVPLAEVPFLSGAASFITGAEPTDYDITYEPTSMEDQVNCVLYFCTDELQAVPFCCVTTLLTGFPYPDLDKTVCIKKTSCHNYEVNLNVEVDFTGTVNDYLQNQVGSINQDTNTFYTGKDGIYYVTIVHMVGDVETTYTYVVFDFCNLFDCVKKILNDILCGKGDDPCCENCDEKEMAKKRHELNKITAIYWQLNSKLSAYRYANDGINCYNANQQIRVDEIKQLFDTLTSLVSSCGECKKKGVVIKNCIGC